MISREGQRQYVGIDGNRIGIQGGLDCGIFCTRGTRINDNALAAKRCGGIQMNVAIATRTDTDTIHGDVVITANPQ